MPRPDETEIRQLIDLLMDSDDKVRLILFYHNNPGMVETVEGLARRLGTNPERLHGDIAAHLKLGILQEVRVGNAVLLRYDARRGAEISHQIGNEFEGQAREATAGSA